MKARQSKTEHGSEHDMNNAFLYHRKVPVGSGFNIDDYAIAVCNELRAALTGLVEESE